MFPATSFSNFNFEMCLAPQNRALSQHLNFQTCSEDLRSIPTILARKGASRHGCGLRATTECNFSFLIWPNGSAPAALASLLFEPPERQNIGKNTQLHDFFTFSRTLTLFLSDSFCSLTLPTSALLLFHLSILLTV